MTNILSEARLNDLKEKAGTLMEVFVKLYLQNFGLKLFEKIKSEMEVKEKTPWKLEHRKWDSVPRTGLETGYFYLKKGDGPGAFDDWKKVYFVENEDYSIDIYEKEDDYQAHREAKKKIMLAGYKAVKEDVSKHYRDELHKLSVGLGLTSSEAHAMTKFSRDCWALTHPQRTNYIFQIPEANNPGCCEKCSLCFLCCFNFIRGKLGMQTGDNDDDDESEPLIQQEASAATEDEKKQRKLLLDVMQKCVDKNKPRDTGTIHGGAFDKTCKDIRSEIKKLKDWQDNGTEAELLVDMMMEDCLTDLRRDVMEELEGPAGIRLAMWYRVRELVRKAFQTIAEKGLVQMQEKGKAIEDKYNPKLKEKLEPVRKMKSAIKDKVQQYFLHKIGEFVGGFAEPLLEPLMTEFEKPLVRGLKNGEEMFSKKVIIDTLPDDKEKRNALLDGIPRSSEYGKQVKGAADQLLSTFDFLRSMDKNFKKLFEDVKSDKLKEKAESCMLEALDAAVYTMEERLDGGAAKNKELMEQIHEDYDHDSLLARKMFVKEVARNLLISLFKKSISSEMESLIKLVNGDIPKELKEFVNIKGLLDDTIDFLIGEPINSAIEEIFANEPNRRSKKKGSRAEGGRNAAANSNEDNQDTREN